MKTKNLLIVTSVLFALSISACKKDDNEPKLTPTEKLLVKEWSVDSLVMKKLSNPETDSVITNDCITKAVIVFDAFKKFQVADVKKNCDSTSLPYDFGTWSLSASGNQLSLKGKRNIIWNIQLLTADKIKATFRDSLSPQHNFVKTIVLKK